MLTTNDFDVGLRVLGPLTGQRRRVPWRTAYGSYLSCESRAHVERESYMSVFTFSDAMVEHLAAWGSPAGFDGQTFAEVVAFDIDRRDDIPQALKDARTLAGVLEETFDAPIETIQVFYSGSKGFHLQVPTALWAPSPGVDFSRVARLFAERIAAEAKVTIDSSIYSRVQMFRAPNSRHPTTGLFKVPLTVAELDRLDVAEIKKLAKRPRSVPIPPPGQQKSASLHHEWQAAETEAAKIAAEQAAASHHDARLTRLTKGVLRGEHLDEGDRHRHLYSAAANLGECGASLALAVELLTDVGRESGLRPSDVQKQIADGHARGSNAA